jgi:hypothetical protein
MLIFNFNFLLVILSIRQFNEIHEVQSVATGHVGLRMMRNLAQMSAGFWNASLLSD